MTGESPSLRDALRDALPGAMKDGDTPGRTAIRSALAAIENAEAVTVPAAEPTSLTGNEYVAGSVGVGVAEAERRELDAEHILEIVSAERDERLAAAAEYRSHGRVEEAERLESEAAALDAFLC
jgi:uncharacterized protein YqeY